MHTHAALITRFYDAFAKKDGSAMAACYTPDVTFTDPAFGLLRGVEAGAMWRMLTARAADLVIRHSNVEANDQSGRCDWEADYTFAATGRWVENRIHAEFEFRDGLISKHVDHFDVWRWSGMAIGGPGRLLGWAPFFRSAIQKKARGQLFATMTKEGVPRPA